MTALSGGRECEFVVTRHERFLRSVQTVSYYFLVAVTTAGFSLVAAYFRVEESAPCEVAATSAERSIGLAEIAGVALASSVFWLTFGRLGKLPRWNWLTPLLASLAGPLLLFGTGLHVSDWNSWGPCMGVD